MRYMVKDDGTIRALSVTDEGGRAGTVTALLHVDVTSIVAGSHLLPVAVRHGQRVQCILLGEHGEADHAGQLLGGRPPRRRDLRHRRCLATRGSTLALNQDEKVVTTNGYSK